MQVDETKLAGVLLLTPKRFEDQRGFFCESWNKRVMADAGLDIDWVQDNHSLSIQANTLRGLHFQAPPHAQAKLVRCGRGAFLDVAVDIRQGSPTYGCWDSFEISAQNGRQVFIPEGFLHGFLTREPETEILYKCSDFYARDCDVAVRFNSAALAIDWGLRDVDPILSPKDEAAPDFSDFVSPFVWENAS